MVKLDEFDIYFDNGEHVYFAGQEISGRIVIKNSEEKKVNEILLEIKGCAKTYWTKHSGKSRCHCSASDSYFCEQLNTKYTHQFEVVPSTSAGKTSNSGADNIRQETGRRTSKRPSSSSVSPTERRITLTSQERVLPAGSHEIPFSYTLPKSLPSSFEGEYGYVRYTCRAICERPWDFDISTRRAFTVIGIEDLNEDSEAMRPATNSGIIHRKLWCLSRGEVVVELQSSHTGYTPGETIRANVKIHNQSRRPIRMANLSLSQNVCYKAKTFSGSEQTRQSCKIVARVDYNNEIRPNSVVSWDDVQIVVPSVTPRLSTCKIIEISYVLQIGIHSDIVVSVPILIGTIPLLSEVVKRSISINAKMAEEARNGNNHASQTSVAPDDSSVVQVTITDESGRTAAVKDDATASPSKDDKIAETVPVEDKREDADAANGTCSKKRVRMPSSILSELYPTLRSPYYRESCFGRVSISDENERTQFGDSLFAPKYPFYTDD